MANTNTSFVVLRILSFCVVLVATGICRGQRGGCKRIFLLHARMRGWFCRFLFSYERASRVLLVCAQKDYIYTDTLTGRWPPIRRDSTYKKTKSKSKKEKRPGKLRSVKPKPWSDTLIEGIIRHMSNHTVVSPEKPKNKSQKYKSRRCCVVVVVCPPNAPP